METEEYLYSFPVHDIPDYEYLFIRNGEQVFVVSKETGEFVETLSLSDYTNLWRREWQNNPAFKSYYLQGIKKPDNPDKAETLDELKSLCSDKTRHRRGNEGYLLDFLLNDSLTKTEIKLFDHLVKNVVVWNYSVVDYNNLSTVLSLSDRQLRNLWRSLQDKGLVSVVNTQFLTDDGWRYLVKVHPMIHWEGRYSAWAAKCRAEYEYEDALTLD